MSGISVRDMLPKEAHHVGLLHDQIHALHVNGRPDLFQPACEDSIGLMQWHSAQHDRRVLVAVREEQLLGYAVIVYVSRAGSPYSLPKRFVHVQEICVDEACRRSGAGRALMEYIYQDAQNRSYPRVELDVWDFNNSAREFYRSIGMSEFRHYLERHVLEWRFSPIPADYAEEAVSLYNSLKTLPGCTWDEEYPDRDLILSDLNSGMLHGAFDGNRLIAVGAAMLDDELIHLDCWRIPSEKPCVFSRIGVHIAYQGKGLAGQMVRYMEETMRLSGFDAVHMLVSPGNEKALRAYRGCGYTECGSTQMYGEDWLCFEKRLS